MSLGIRCAREDSNPDARLRKPVLCPLSYARWCSLTSSRRDARRPGALGESNPVSASVERRRVRWTTKAVRFTARRTTNARRRRRIGMAARKTHPARAHSRTRKRPPRRCPGRPVVTTLWSDDRTAGVAGEERGHAEIRHGQHDARLLAGQDGTSPVLLDGFAHGTAPLGHVGWPTHRNVVDRGRPYAPFPNRTTSFLEFVQESPAETRAPPGYPACRPFLTADELARSPRKPAPVRPRAPSAQDAAFASPSGLGGSDSGDRPRLKSGRLAHFSPRRRETLGLAGDRPGLSAAPGRVPDVPDRPPDADEPRAGPTTGDAPP